MPIWPWVLGGSLLVSLLAVAVGIASFAISAIGSARADSVAAALVKQKVLDLDAAYEDADCDAFEAVVDEELRDLIVDGAYDCELWADGALSLRDDGEYTYEVEVLDAEVHNRVATVSTRESWQDVVTGTQVREFTYVLEQSGDDWIIVAYDEA